MTKKKVKVQYEPHADVLSWELSAKKIDYAQEVGNLVIHFTKDHDPVIVELLQAYDFLKDSKRLIEKRSEKVGAIHMLTHSQKSKK